MTLRWALVLFSVALGVAGGCGADPEAPPERGATYWPSWFPEPLAPDDNPVTAAKAELGRYLFYDPRLSGNGTQSCGSCHRLELAFTDGRVVAEGSTGQLHPRNSPTLANAAYNATLTWANPVLTELEQQALVPLFNEDPIELGVAGHENEIIEHLASDEEYAELFAAAFPDGRGHYDWDHVVKALTSFVRTLVSGNSAFDRFVYSNDGAALSSESRRGMELFFSERLECHHCHGGFNFTESSVHADSAFPTPRFHNTGLYNLDGRGAYPANNTGIFAVTGLPGDMGRFRAPTLRNVAVTAPYMHDGSIATLDEVVRFYEAGGRLLTEGPYAGDGRKNPLKSGFIAGFALSDEERKDLVSFLESLTDDEFLKNPRFADPFAVSTR